MTHRRALPSERADSLLTPARNGCSRARARAGAVLSPGPWLGHLEPDVAPSLSPRPDVAQLHLPGGTTNDAPEQLLPTLGVGQGLWKIKSRSFISQHQLHPVELELFRTDARYLGGQS